MGTMMNGEEHLYLDCHDWICVFKKCFHQDLFSYSYLFFLFNGHFNDLLQVAQG
jgi:hypothetical protein